MGGEVLGLLKKANLHLLVVKKTANKQKIAIAKREVELQKKELGSINKSGTKSSLMAANMVKGQTRHSTLTKNSRRPQKSSSTRPSSYPQTKTLKRPKKRSSRKRKTRKSYW